MNQFCARLVFMMFHIMDSSGISCILFGKAALNYFSKLEGFVVQDVQFTIETDYFVCVWNVSCEMQSMFQ